MRRREFITLLGGAGDMAANGAGAAAGANAAHRRSCEFGRGRSGRAGPLSSDFGQLAAKRHLIVGLDCAITGLATVGVAAAPRAVRNLRRFIGILPSFGLSWRWRVFALVETNIERGETSLLSYFLHD